ncbi:MAG: HU family DNA-binding protein [Desulfobacterales bacterium]|jgi:nucleoid DNA-binding protein
MVATKAGTIEAVHQEIGFARKQSTGMVETLLEIIEAALPPKVDLVGSGFGKFCVNRPIICSGWSGPILKMI